MYNLAVKLKCQLMSFLDENFNKCDDGDLGWYEKDGVTVEIYGGRISIWFDWSTRDYKSSTYTPVPVDVYSGGLGYMYALYMIKGILSTDNNVRKKMGLALLECDGRYEYEVFGK